MTSEPIDWQTRADELAAKAVASGQPWDRPAPSDLLRRWAEERRARGRGQRAVVVGTGLGADAAYIADLGYDTTAFDISPTAVAMARDRVNRTDVRFEVADLLDLPDAWLGGFHLVVEIYTVQALPRSLRAQATAAVGRLVASDGRLVVVQAVLGAGDDPDEGPPWPLTRTEIEAFAGDGLGIERIDEIGTDGSRFNRRWLAELARA